ncbi:MAG: CRTAC1 family protein [Bryobacteraceae bacterium]|nr:CRTAC1 family protein [Bryobacteraceae bacterium]
MKLPVKLAFLLCAAAASAAEPAVTFRASTLDMVVRNGAAGNKHQIETMIAGVAVLDYDNDGWPDIFVANGAEIPSLRKSAPSFHNRLFRNNREGAFTDVTDRAGLAGAGYSMGAAAADFDNDGFVDLFVTGVRANTLYRNRGDGTFADVTATSGVPADGPWTVAAGWFDYDNDGRLDLFVVRYVEWNPDAEPYCGLQKPGYRMYCHPKFYRPLPNALFRNEGNGRFRDVSAAAGIAAFPGKGMGVAFGDYDADGWTDVFVANDTIPNFLFRNLGNGKFEEIALAAGVALNANGAAHSWMGADLRDYDNDGRDDVFVTALTREGHSLFRNVGRGLFAPTGEKTGVTRESIKWSGWSTGLYDLNNDGWKDIFVAGGHVMDNADTTSNEPARQPNQVFVNRRGAAFSLELLPGAALHRGAAFGDFDRDGRVDVVVTRLNEAPLVLWNTTPQAGHWVSLKLTGSASNRDAIGARVRIKTASGEQWNHVSTSVGYAGSSEPLVHFGLGPDNTVLELEIRWPSGRTQTLRNVPGNQTLAVQEPSRS